MRTFFLPALLIASLLAAAGCATREPPEVIRIQDVAAADAPSIDACWVKVLKSPQHQALRQKMSDYSDSPTLAMRINTEKVTTVEAAQLLSLHQEHIAPCRKMAVESAGKVDPAIVAILADSYADTDANYARFVGREISWGEFVTANQTLVTERRGRLLAAGEALQKNLKDTAPVDPDSRRRANAALANWSRQQQALLATSKAASAGGAPQVTSCQYDDATLRCAMIATR